MKQEDIIKTMTDEVFPKCKGLNAVLLMGSFARGTFTKGPILIFRYGWKRMAFLLKISFRK